MKVLGLGLCHLFRPVPYLTLPSLVRFDFTTGSSRVEYHNRFSASGSQRFIELIEAGII